MRGLLVWGWTLLACAACTAADANANAGCEDVACGRVTCPVGKSPRTRSGECCPVCAPDTATTAGSGATSGGTGGTGAGASGSGGMVASAAGAGGTASMPGCPTSAPPPRTSCDEKDLACGYGSGTQCVCVVCCNAPGCTGCPDGQDDGALAWRCPDPAGEPGCPPACAGCAAPDTPIATPAGERPIAELREGDLVYSLEHDAIVVVPIARTSRARVHDHVVVRLLLDTGRVLQVSGVHPTADGRAVASLRTGARLDGVGVQSAEVVRYPFEHTYDILPASSTGAYFAAGVALGSTLGGTSP